MKVAEYRTEIDHVRRTTSDFSSCVTPEERRKWVMRAERCLFELRSVECLTAKAHDRHRMTDAVKALKEQIQTAKGQS